jgi:hypothetical protein
MEIHYSELENQNENPYEKYWVQKQEEQPKKKKVSFNDILTNMNLVVNKQGVLQYITSSKEQEQQEQQMFEYEASEQQSYLPQQQKQGQNQKPLDPAVKHSFIYNKYFKDYKDNVVNTQEVKVPKTLEEYRQMVFEEQKKRYEERKRIAEIKSTKLIFTTNPSYPVASVKNIHPSKNTLRKMTFM